MESKEEMHAAERMKFVEKWAQYVTTHDDWSKLQKELIDSQLENARQIRLTREQVDTIKGSK